MYFCLEGNYCLRNRSKECCWYLWPYLHETGVRSLSPCFVNAINEKKKKRKRAKKRAKKKKSNKRIILALTKDDRILITRVRSLGAHGGRVFQPKKTLMEGAIKMYKENKEKWSFRYNATAQIFFDLMCC